MNPTCDVTPIVVVYSAFLIASVFVFVGMILLI